MIEKNSIVKTVFSNFFFFDFICGSLQSIMMEKMKYHHILYTCNMFIFFFFHTISLQSVNEILICPIFKKGDRGKVKKLKGNNSIKYRIQGSIINNI